MLAKYRFSLVEIAAHIERLRTPAGKHEGRLRRMCHRAGGENARRIACFPILHNLFRSRADHSAAVAETLAPDLERVRNVSQIEFGMMFQVLDQIAGRSV